MNKRESRRGALTSARVYLEMRGYFILEQSFHRPNCEVDIICSKTDIVYFVAVYNGDIGRHSQSPSFSEFIDSHRNDVQLASRIWIEESKYRGNYDLAAIEIDTKTHAILNFITEAF